MTEASRSPQIGDQVILIRTENLPAWRTFAVARVREIVDEAESDPAFVVALPGGDRRSVARDGILTSAEAYIDARGVQMEPMPFSEALVAVHELAIGHQPDRNEIPESETTLRAVVDRQGNAIATMGDMIERLADYADGELTRPIAAGVWPDKTVGCSSELDPNDAVEAVRICLELGESSIDSKVAERDVELADQIDRAQQACDLVRDLIGMHGAELRGKFVEVAAKP